ncbi:hypothetical protein [Nonomuraea dietziae]
MIVSASRPSGVAVAGADQSQVEGARADPLDEPVGVVPSSESSTPGCAR